METIVVDIKLSSTSENTKFLRHQVTVYVLYTSLSIFNFTYLLIRIIKLNQKKFHFLMFGILQTCYCCYILEYVTVDYNYTFAFCFNEFWYLSNEMVHSIFAIKYWVLSRKISEFVTK